MKNENVIEIDSVSKKFSKNINASKKQLKKIFYNNLFGIDDSIELQKDEFFAIKDLSLEIRKNEKLAILGANGSGKSTLLKMLNGIYMPNGGEIRIRGAVSSILELSSGFNKELSGRENIYLKFALQGKAKESVDEIIDDVIEFSGLKDFMDTPLKNYSSGMKSKLGFSIVTSLKPEILILDEVFAAGDKAFIEKSRKRIQELYTQTTTILVSHSMSVVKDFADRVIVLNKGELIFDGKPTQAIKFYENMMKPKILDKKINSLLSYSVVTNVKNSEKYLDEYFKMFLEQTLDFEKHLHLIIVDENSNDNSVVIIKKYQKLFPNNIKYIYQGCEGRSLARNTGMKTVETDWFTFVDVKDKINNTYFEEVDKSAIDTDISVISCKNLLYNEDNIDGDVPYLNYRFKNIKKVVNPNHMQGIIEVNANSLFFRNRFLNNDNFSFSEKVESIFVDGHFTNSFLLNNSYINIAYLSQALYYCRDISMLTLAMEKDIRKYGLYTENIEFYLLSILKFSKKKKDSIPIFIQRYVLFSLQIYVKVSLNDNNTNNLSLKEKTQFHNVLKNIFVYIEAKTIEESSVGGIWHKFRLGYYNLYKDRISFKQVCYIESYNEKTLELEIYYYYHTESEEIFLLNNQVIKPIENTIIEHKLLDKIFVYEKRLSLSIEGLWSFFEAKIATLETDISFKSKRYKQGIQLMDIKK